MVDKHTGQQYVLRIEATDEGHTIRLYQKGQGERVSLRLGIYRLFFVVRSEQNSQNSPGAPPPGVRWAGVMMNMGGNGSSPVDANILSRAESTTSVIPLLLTPIPSPMMYHS